ncbi:MAG TPA: FAD-linked oxidase C-terminal domain-containing protein [Usitatibacteraceae bacterium]|nr:FAD-linked oxidase C-terminal domain-containing protein [Usitatibacteraceae bacterium]
MTTTHSVRFSSDRNAPAHPIAERLRREVDGEVLFDRASRGRYATDASIYQIEPVGVVVPRSLDAAVSALQIAAEAGVPILPRGGGTSQGGQTVGAALVIDASKYLNRLVEVDPVARRAIVEPGLVLDHLNAQLRRDGLWFPVDVSTAAQATLGGMTGNNSCGSRSMAYGYMVHRVAAIDACLADGTRGRFGPAAELVHPAIRALSDRAAALWAREKDEIAARMPKVARRVAGYNLDRLAPGELNLAKLLVGSEGTLAWFERITLDLADIPKHKALGVAHFPRFYDAMDATQHIVKLGPCAVELVDRTMIELARAIPAFAATIGAFVRGEPDAILLVEFAGEDRDEQVRGVKRLAELMADLGFPGGVVEILDAGRQKELWEVRKAGLNIMMSMKGDGKPVSFIEDCAVPLEHLAEYTSKLTEVFRKHGTEGTFYAHASVGCLHVRPILNMKGDGTIRMRAIAEEAADLVRRYKGAYSGEHGDGLVRSEWIAPFFGPRLTAALGEIKGWFDPRGLMNPGKIVNPPKQDDRSLLRYKPGYHAEAPATALDWSAWGGLPGAVEMCNNNGHCRKFDAGTMCPSYRVTRDEVHVTRGRANTLRLALSGQLGEDGLASDAVRDAFDLCVSCKGCRRECPTGVDMARMKIEFLNHDRARNGHSVRDRLVGMLPAYAPWASRFAPLVNAAQRMPGVSRALHALAGFDSRRELPAFSARPWLAAQPPYVARGGREVVLFADTFNNWFEPGNLAAAQRVISAAGFEVVPARGDDARPLCCGRTYLSAGMVDRAKAESRRMIDALAPWIERGVPVVGLEPSCLYSLKDEFLAMHPGDSRATALAELAVTFESFIARALRDGARIAWREGHEPEFLVHGHCHQKAFGSFDDTLAALRAIPGARVSAVESSCCGMAGSFGHEHYDVSMAMGEASLLPAVRAAAPATVVVAAGTSCRHQIDHGASREAVHPAVALAAALAP